MRANFDREILFDQLEAGIKSLNISLSKDDLILLINFTEMLLKWNKAYNLTAIAQPEEIITRHILDSLSIVPYIVGSRIIDVGSGAGFPGIPCAFAMPTSQFVLLDSNGKKTRFLTQAISELGLMNVEIIQNRVEDYYPEQCFNTIMTRAFSALENVIRFTQHLACKNGQILIMKGTYPETELASVTHRTQVYKLQVPGLNEQRHLVRIEGLAQ